MAHMARGSPAPLFLSLQAERALRPFPRKQPFMVAPHQDIGVHCPQQTLLGDTEPPACVCTSSSGGRPHGLRLPGLSPPLCGRSSVSQFLSVSAALAGKGVDGIQPGGAGRRPRAHGVPGTAVKTDVTRRSPRGLLGGARGRGVILGSAAGLRTVLPQDTCGRTSGPAPAPWLTLRPRLQRTWGLWKEPTTPGSRGQLLGSRADVTQAGVLPSEWDAFSSRALLL